MFAAKVTPKQQSQNPLLCCILYCPSVLNISVLVHHSSPWLESLCITSQNTAKPNPIGKFFLTYITVTGLMFQTTSFFKISHFWQAVLNRRTQTLQNRLWQPQRPMGTELYLFIFSSVFSCPQTSRFPCVCLLIVIERTKNKEAFLIFMRNDFIHI